MRLSAAAKLGLSGYGVAAWLALAPAAAAPADQIAVAYDAPKNPAHQPIYELLTRRRSLDRIRQLLAPFRLPHQLLIKVAGCDGVSNAWYDKRTITICYEYLDDIERNAPEDTSPEGVSRIDALVGPFYDVVLHEFAHALFDLLKVPILGREEDAADQVSAYIMLHFGRTERRRLIVGTAYAYTRDFPASDMRRDRTYFAGEHGTPQQRYYNLLCIAYGADQQAFADFVTKSKLPEDRAAGCSDEYKALVRAFRTLIGPHIDAQQARRVGERTWLPDTVAALKRPMASAKR